MKAMILAAGYGKRLKEITTNIPKPLVKAGGKHLIDYSLSLCENAGVRSVIVNTHHIGYQIKEYFSGLKKTFEISIVEEPEILGTGGGVANAAGLLRGGSFFLMNSDIICDIDLNEVLDFHVKNRDSATMVLGRLNKGDQMTPVEVKDGKVVKIGESGDYFFKGIHVLNDTVFDYLEPRYSSIVESFYQKAINDGLPIGAFIHEGKWFDMGTPKSLEEYEKLFPKDEDEKIN
ncbi:MAG: NDP-sugar synthase [Fibrobacterota bacterium]